MHDNNYKTKENESWTKDKIEPQHILQVWRRGGVY